MSKISDKSLSKWACCMVLNSIRWSCEGWWGGVVSAVRAHSRKEMSCWVGSEGSGKRRESGREERIVSERVRSSEGEKGSVVEPGSGA